jgi:DNA-binding NarL/FixJ family response regulator
MAAAAGSRDERMSRSAAVHKRPGRADVNGHQHPQRTTVVLGRLDSVVALGVAAFLRDDLRLQVIECGPADRALEDALAEWQPQVAVVGERAEPTTVEHLRSICPQTMMLVLAYDPSHDQGMRLLAAGANCVARCVPELDLGAMVHRTARGERFLATADGAWVQRRYPSRAEPLTGREREVFVYLTKGASHAVIACALDISYRTVQWHVARIIEKLGVQNRGELIGMPVPGERATG